MSVRVRSVIGRISNDGVTAHDMATGRVGKGKTLVEAYADLDRQEQAALTHKHEVSPVEAG